MVQLRVEKWCRLAARVCAEAPFVAADLCLARSSKRQKQQALRRAGGPDEVMLKKT
jgi:hypothetical protein